MFACSAISVRFFFLDQLGCGILLNLKLTLWAIYRPRCNSRRFEEPTRVKGAFSWTQQNQRWISAWQFPLPCYPFSSLPRTSSLLVSFARTESHEHTQTGWLFHLLCPTYLQEAFCFPCWSCGQHTPLLTICQVWSCSGVLLTYAHSLTIDTLPLLSLCTTLTAYLRYSKKPLSLYGYFQPYTAYCRYFGERIVQKQFTWCTLFAWNSLAWSLRTSLWQSPILGFLRQWGKAWHRGIN